MAIWPHLFLASEPPKLARTKIPSLTIEGFTAKDGTEVTTHKERPLQSEQPSKLEAAQLAFYTNWFSLDTQGRAAMLPPLVSARYSEEAMGIYWQELISARRIPQADAFVTKLKLLKRSPVYCEYDGIGEKLELLTLELEYFYRVGHTEGFGKFLLRDIWGISKNSVVTWCPLKFVNLEDAQLPNGTRGWQLKPKEGIEVWIHNGVPFEIGRKNKPNN